MKALIVEDDFVSGKLLKKILEPFGEIEIANSGKKGVAIFIEELCKKKPFDLICLDIMMPQMDGHEVLKLIREEEYRKGIVEGVKIIMTTALGDFQNIKDSYKEQCEDYLIKPINKDKLIRTIKKLGILDDEK